MDRRRLAFGLGFLLIVAGLLLAFFTPGGLFNRTMIGTPFGSFDIGESSPWPVVGYVLVGIGAVGLVIGFAMKKPPGPGA
jgi:hypothetical protein